MANVDTSLDSPSSSLHIVELDARAHPRIEAFINTHSEGLIYHHPIWMQVLEKEYGQKGICLGCEDSQGQLRGVLPLLHTKGLPFVGESSSRRLSSLPRTPVAGPLALNRAATAALVRAAVERVGDEGKTRLQLKVASAHLNEVVEGVVGTPWWSRYVLTLPEKPDELRFGDSRNHKKIRSAVRKAHNQGVRVRAADSESELRNWYKLYLHAMRWHAVPPRPYRFFQTMWEMMRPRGLMRLLLAEEIEERKLLAGSIFLTCGQTFSYAFNGRRSEALSLGANDIIQWQAIHEACQGGFRYYDFGEVAASNKSLAHFKRKWGSEPTQLYRYYYPAPHKQQLDSLETDSELRNFLHAVWRRLPLRATALVGDLTYRYL